MESLISPLQEKNRIVSLDMMRGFAILGIFLVNMLSFHSPFLYIDPLQWWQNPLDQGVYIFIDIFVQASFYPLFSMLFGYGLVLLRERAQLKKISFIPIALRRLSLLLVIGLAHAFFIWHGDILFNYALLGFIFLLFIRLSGRSMMIIGNLLYILPNLFFIVMLFLTILFLPGEKFSINNPFLSSQSLDIYQNGSFFEITAQRMDDWTYTNNVFGLVMMLFSLLPLFLIGGSAAKYRWLEQVDKHRKGLTITLILTSIFGFVFKLFPYMLATNWATTYVQDILGGPLLAISYGLTIALFAEKKYLNKLLTSISYVGRMSFSNYLLQSIVATLIFYSYGLGVYGKVSVAMGTLLVLVIYTCQIFLSRLWLKSFYYGPAEWAWRNFTYFKKQKLVRKPKGLS
ncbi:DUF418 domain-containing protein [Bacillus sp. V3B]|uniref:DUF418 domain-containing protein n=1 Tax=Bacillus sp. V3B TaxID=2804915 RepID=UPI00210A875D|nr:DUF418 domain-containing protein [Bacillus sp. V3B]MCQ6274354.1 DUF418 domain-containing protein [Bacillus sp. V3B]